MPQCEVLDSVLAVYTNLNSEWARARRQPTAEGIHSHLELGVLTGEPLAKAWEKLTDRKVKDRVLGLLQFERFRTWNESPISALFARAVAFAAMDGDDIFFKRLGRRLEEEPIPFKRPAKHSPLAALLLEHWVSQQGLCLCWFSDKALTGLLSKTEGYFSEDAVRKARERLHLRKLRRPLLRAVRWDGKRFVCE